MSDHIVVMLEKVTILAMRMRKILEGSRVCVYEADSKYKLYNTLEEIDSPITLVILDLDLEHELAVALLKETRQKVESGTPIVVLTPGRPRNFFVEAMLSGASDFLLKPFTNEVFVSKVHKYLNPESVQSAEIVTTDLGHYLKGELRKAEKGHFAISILFLAFVKDGEEEENHTADTFIYENMKDLFWETDIFIRFAGKYYLGVFPFCDEKNTAIIGQKIQEEFGKLKNENDMIKGYRAVSVFVSFPSDTDEPGKVFEILLERVKEQLSEDISIALDI